MSHLISTGQYVDTYEPDSDEDSENSFFDWGSVEEADRVDDDDGAEDAGHDVDKDGDADMAVTSSEIALRQAQRGSGFDYMTGRVSSPPQDHLPEYLGSPPGSSAYKAAGQYDAWDGTESKMNTGAEMYPVYESLYLPPLNPLVCSEPGNNFIYALRATLDPVAYRLMRESRARAKREEMADLQKNGSGQEQGGSTSTKASEDSKENEPIGNGSSSVSYSQQAAGASRRSGYGVGEGSSGLVGGGGGGGGVLRGI